MLSTLSSLLPSALSDKLEKLDLRNSNANANANANADEGDTTTGDGREDGDRKGKKEKKKRSTTNEVARIPFQCLHNLT